ncbi:hypothetical protein NSMM_90104 [Nitrosomonas mobilis]|uniref:Uncharacterized protein n=1 Tax=Nitrosomonas mobilis TaxID=51642 RepID=A0A1G5SJG4_9PROT|nr:hypothetical protein NSMM_90104 [Nitrosomonas mobilis]
MDLWQIAESNRGGDTFSFFHFFIFSFFQNHLIEVRQSGEQLILGRFSDNNTDFKDPAATPVLTRVTQ